MIALLWALGCAPDDPGREETIRIDCTTMVPLGVGLWKTPAWAWDEAAQALVQRCVVWPAGAMTGADATFVGGAAVLDLPGAVDQLHAQVVVNGQRYLSLSGAATFDALDGGGGGKASGTWSFEAQGEDDGQVLTVEGSFDWCALGQREDCPGRFEDGQLPGFTLTTPGLGAVSGRANACRMLVDPATGALQVDLQAAVWDGFNVAQRFVGECTDGQGPVLDNHLVFRAAGVTGPGTYGPAAKTRFPGVDLPGLTFTHPMTFLREINPTQACSLYFVPGEVSLQPESVCTWTVARDPDRFVLDCTEARHTSAPSVFTLDAVGDLHLEADCAWVEAP